MWWKVALRVAVAVGLDKWAKKKAVDLAAKIKAKAEAKFDAMTEHADSLVKMVEPASTSGTAVFRAKDGRDYVVRVERSV